MQFLKKMTSLTLITSLSVLLVGCAAGAATSAYSVKAQSADGLSAEAEQRIIDRAKRELAAEMYQKNMPRS